MDTQTKELTWEEIVAIEPALLQMYNEAVRRGQRGVQNENDCANVVWYRNGGMKDRFVTLVGWKAQKPALIDSLTYELAYQKIYGALPDCTDKCNLREGEEDDEDES